MYNVASVKHHFSRGIHYAENAAFFQPKPSVNKPDDVYKHEADATAGTMMRRKAPSTPNTFFSPQIIQRKCTHCEEEEKKMQRKEVDQITTGTSAPTEKYLSSLSGGKNLSSEERSFFEPRFGYDFANVRLHTNNEANESAKTVNALAYTHGNNIVFGPGQYQPGNQESKKLLAHELTHVAQQNGAMIHRQAPPGNIGIQANCQTPAKPVVQTTTSDMFYIYDVKPPCYACPNSDPNACPKLAQEIFPPVATPPVQFSWQVIFQTLFKDKRGTGMPGPGKKTHVIQKIEKAFNFTTSPASAYTYTSPYWEAFALDANGQTEIDYWQFEIPDLTAGTWEQKGTLYLTEQLPAGMAVGNVPDSAGAPSIATEPKGLGHICGTRRITGRFNFTGANKQHFYQ
jgi:hypothetical protein